jgi:mono/diheme cytochrome c family protein
MKKTFITAALAVAALTLALNVSAADGKEIYTKDCAKCHGADGKGETKMGKKLSIRDYTDAKVQASVTDADAIKAVKEGLKDKAGKTVMKPSEGLSDADIKAVVAHMRTFKK